MPVKTVLVAALLALTCGAFIQQSDSQPPYAPAKPLPDPVIFAEGVISTPENESGIAFSSDGRTAYFTVGTASDSFSAIAVSRYENGHWATPEIADFSGRYKDQDPALSPDGTRLFFASTRPVEGKTRRDLDIWVVEKTGAGWSEPKNLGAPVNTTDAEVHPCVSRDGTLFFSSIRPGGMGFADIYQARLVNGAYSEPETLGQAVNSPGADWVGCLAPDESFLLFSSWRGQQTANLYLSRKVNGAWQPAIDLGSRLNTNAMETSPLVSPDGRYLFFVSNRQPSHEPERRTRPITRAEMEERSREQAEVILNGRGNIFQVEMPTVNQAIEQAVQGQRESDKR